MTTILLLVIFTAYIGLGVPDSLIGAAWPAIYADMSLPVSYVNFITVIIQGGTVLSSFASASVIKKLGTAKVTALSRRESNTMWFFNANFHRCCVKKDSQCVSITRLFALPRQKFVIKKLLRT